MLIEIRSSPFLRTANAWVILTSTAESIEWEYENIRKDYQLYVGGPES